jgi:hypothetical protein
MEDVIWIRSTVKTPAGVDEQFITMDRAQWDAMTDAERDERLKAFARLHQDFIAPADAVVFDPAEIPDDYLSGS